MLNELSAMVKKEEPQKNYWYKQPNALEEIQAMDATKRNWNFSPLKYDFAIHGGRAYLKKLDEYRADRNVVPVADNPDGFTTGLDKIMDNIASMMLDTNDKEKIEFFKKLNDFLSPFAIHPTTHNREKYLQKVKKEHAQLKAA